MKIENFFQEEFCCKMLSMGLLGICDRGCGSFCVFRRFRRNYSLERDFFSNCRRINFLIDFKILFKMILKGLFKTKKWKKTVYCY